MAEWKEYTGSDEQIEEMHLAADHHGYLLKMEREDWDENEVIEGKHSHQRLSLYGVTHYLICEPHQHIDMIKQWADTGQPVWVRYEWRDKTWPGVETYVTDAPDWNIPNAEYSFTPFDETFSASAQCVLPDHPAIKRKINTDYDPSSPNGYD